MKKVSYVTLTVFAALSMAFSSCKKDVTQAVNDLKSTPFTAGYNSPSQIQTIQATKNVGAFSMKQDSVFIDIDTILIANNLKRTQIKSVVMKTITFSIESGADNFNFIKYMNANSTIGGQLQEYKSANPMP